jgi:dTDP-4-amino-4,6-dideoxygalactose transaminase
LIYFSRHQVAPSELELVESVLKSGVTSGDGPQTARATEMLEALHDEGSKALLTTSCTHALELSALLCDFGPDDEIVLPSFTFSSTANAFALRGCKLRFADIAADTFSMEAAQIEAALSPRTRAVVTVAYGGVVRDWQKIVRLCHERNLTLIEDNAHGLFAKHSGRPLGTFGRLSALSFHATKNISCGEGGALILNDSSLQLRAEVLREKGTDRSRFLRGEVDKYTWRGVGSSYLPSEILAAVLVAQLQHAAVTQPRRLSVWQHYHERLEPQVRRLGIALQTVPEHLEHPAHVFALLMPAGRERSRLLTALKARRIVAVSHYEPLHLAPAHSGKEELPTTERVAASLVRLPLHAGLSLEDANRVANAVIEELEKLG